MAVLINSICCIYSFSAIDSSLFDKVYNSIPFFVYPACPVAPGDGTGVGPADRTGVP